MDLRRLFSPAPRRPAVEVGRDAERFARRYLEARGLRFLEANFRSRRGEIDLIMADGEQLVFVEVRYRRNGRFGGADESVDTHKRRSLIRAAGNYLQQKRTAAPCRFDVVALSGEPARPQIHWIKNAFDAE